jgi:DNA-directed RNA polymerase subunit L
LGDIKNSVSFLDNEGSIKLETNEKVTIENYKSKTTDGVLVKVNDENHTVGNLVQHYLRDMFLADRNTPDNLLSIASYRMPHPTIEEIEFILVPNNDISIDHMISHIVSKMPYDIKDSDKLSESKRLTIIHTYLVSLLIDSIDKTTKQLTNFLEIFKMKSGITSTTYTINE